MQEFMSEVYSSSQLMVLDFTQITAGIPPYANIQTFFADYLSKGENPRLPENRQAFNNSFLRHVNKRYLVSRYAEDRSSMLEGTEIAQEGRTYHMGIDIFARDLENIYAPCDGEIIRASYEQQSHGYGYYLIFKPSMLDVYFFFGHLSHKLISSGPVRTGDHIATLGDYLNDENGGWSRHLHLQVLRDLPQDGETPIGYSSKQDLITNQERFPDLMTYFPEWKVVSNFS